MKYILSILCFLFTKQVFSQSDSINLDLSNSSKIVQQHIAPFNNRNLDSFSNAFHKDIMVTRFPDDTMYIGKEKLKENYKKFFKENKKSHVSVLNRMTLKNWVIDEELGTVNNSTNRHISIYSTKNDKIKSMTFVGNKQTTSNPESIVNKQLLAYNNRDIDKFIETYSGQIKLYMFPNQLISKGHETMRKQYAPMFEKVSDLNAQIVNRMVLGNKVIDKEKVTYNGNTFYAIAIYEVKDGKISKVTFIQ
ncbi:nuclear transport factor 2 family protein [Algibacter marinivivus]|nr:nuclear transport factor 2 family protein [Algibacter marinivivus]